MSHQIVCFQHKNYNGVDAPQISCKTCCNIFLSRVRKNRAEGKYVNYSAMNLNGTGLQTKSRKSFSFLGINKK